jgi:hypothetical protein
MIMVLPEEPITPGRASFSSMVETSSSDSIGNSAARDLVPGFDLFGHLGFVAQELRLGISWHNDHGFDQEGSIFDSFDRNSLFCGLSYLKGCANFARCPSRLTADLNKSSSSC